MKKVLFAILSAGLAFASCSNETEMQSLPNAGEEVMATIQVGMAPKTRATIDNDGAAAHVNRCILEVRTGDNKKVYRHVEVSVNKADLTATFRLPLVISQKYDFLFWADNANFDSSIGKFSDKYYNTQDLTAVKIMEETTGNLDEKDAFFQADHDVLFTGTAALKEYTLTRPFAQVNIVTTDLLDIRAANDQTLAEDELWPAKISVDYTTPFPTQFDVSTGVASEPKVINRKAEAVYGCETAATNNTLNMDYIFVNKVGADDNPEQNTLFGITKAVITSKNGKVITILESKANIPMKRNYRTNIIGSFLTDPQDFKVTINPLWLGDNLNDTLPAPPSPDDPQGCVLTEDEEGNVTAEYTPGSTTVVVPEGATGFIANPEHPSGEGGVYNETIESLTLPSTINDINQAFVSMCHNLHTITINCSSDSTLYIDVSAFYNCGEYAVPSKADHLTLTFIGTPKDVVYREWSHPNQKYNPRTNANPLNYGESHGPLEINVPKTWKSEWVPKATISYTVNRTE